MRGERGPNRDESAEEALFLIMNSGEQSVSFTLPSAEEGGRWERLLATSQATSQATNRAGEAGAVQSVATYPVGAQSFVALRLSW